jgi:hypothetical protein
MKNSIDCALYPKHKFIGIYIVLQFISILLFTSCGNSLSRGKAEKLLIKEYKSFPAVEVFEIDFNYSQTKEHSKVLEKIQSKGIIINSEYYMGGTGSYDVTETGKKYVFSKRINSFQNTAYSFVTNSFVFIEIIGIRVNEQDKTAIVSWKGKTIGVTPFGEYFGFKENDEVGFNTLFKQFDDGWRIDYTLDKKIGIIKNFTFFNEKGDYIGI